MTKTKRENQRIQLTKRMLKESLLKLMSEKSIQRITVTELCAAAEINRSTFYNHYGCPADVLADIEEGVYADLEHIWRRTPEGKNAPINRRIEALCTYFQAHRELAKQLFRNNDPNSGFASKLINASHVQLAYAQDLSHIQNQDNVKLAMTFITNGIYHAIRQWILEDIPKTPKEMGDFVYQLATQGWDGSVLQLSDPSKRPS